MYETEIKRKRHDGLCPFTTLTAVGAFIKIPVPVVPFTLQFLLPQWRDSLLGKRLGALSVAVYVALWTCRPAHFAEGGRPWVSVQTQLRLSDRFCAGAWVTGAIAEKAEGSRALAGFLPQTSQACLWYICSAWCITM